MKWAIMALEPGDHIRIYRRNYYHHGVYIGGNKVIHYTGEKGDNIRDSKDVKIRETSIDFFANGGVVEKAIYNHKEKRIRYSVEEIIKRAKTFLGRGNYNFVTNNCEKFANECCYRGELSSQTNSWRKIVAEKIDK